MHHFHLYNIFICFVPLMLMGFSVLINRKPLILNYKWFFLFMILVFIQPCIIIFQRPIVVSSFFPVILFGVVLGYMYYLLRGYMVIGADGDDFQKAFTATLTEGNYEYEQTFSSLKIKEPPLEISVAFQPWTGSGQIRLRSKEHKETFDKIISSLKTKDIKLNRIIPYFYIILGLLILGITLFRD